MVLLQIACLATAAIYVVGRARLEGRPLHLIRRLLVLAAAAWATEDVAVRLYGAHEYSQYSIASLDRLPLATVLVWPIAVQSARDLGTCLWAGRDRPAAWRVALTAGGLVVGDAALLAVVAGPSGLVQWSAPGHLSAPLAAVVGWGAFGAVAVYVLERAAWQNEPWYEALILVAAPVSAHIAVASVWWGALRWVDVPVPAGAALLVLWAAAGGLTERALRLRTRQRVPRALLWLRAPGAAIVLAIAAARVTTSPLVLACVLAFAPPYLALVARGARSR
ncbi:MAG: hypothetical protein R3B70_16840 [Polyangiaceae bacterium]